MNAHGHSALDPVTSANSWQDLCAPLVHAALTTLLTESMHLWFFSQPSTIPSEALKPHSARLSWWHLNAPIWLIQSHLRGWRNSIQAEIEAFIHIWMKLRLEKKSDGVRLVGLRHTSIITSTTFKSSLWSLLCHHLLFFSLSLKESKRRQKENERWEKVRKSEKF